MVIIGFLLNRQRPVRTFSLGRHGRGVRVGELGACSSQRWGCRSKSLHLAQARRSRDSCLGRLKILVFVVRVGLGQSFTGQRVGRGTAVLWGSRLGGPGGRLRIPMWLPRGIVLRIDEFFWTSSLWCSYSRIFRQSNRTRLCAPCVCHPGHSTRTA